MIESVEMLPVLMSERFRFDLFDGCVVVVLVFSRCFVSFFYRQIFARVRRDVLFTIPKSHGLFQKDFYTHHFSSLGFAPKQQQRF